LLPATTARANNKQRTTGNSRDQGPAAPVNLLSVVCCLQQRPAQTTNNEQQATAAIRDRLRR
jgi:hypothetical protein